MTKPWIRSLSEDANLRLFCFPFAGGGGADFRSWRSHLPESIDLCPVILPGREDRLTEPSFTNMEALVEGLCEALDPLLSQTPYAFFGYSMGSWIAYALTQELYRRGKSLPQVLLVAARKAPHLPDSPPLISTLPDEQMIVAIQERYQAIPKLLLENPEILNLYLPSLRADFQILNTYRWPQHPPLPIPIHGFYGIEDSLTPIEMMEAWGIHTSQDFSLVGLPGGHFFLRDSRAELTQQILKFLSYSQ